MPKLMFWDLKNQRTKKLLEKNIYYGYRSRARFITYYQGTRGLQYTSCWEIPADTHGGFVTVVRKTWPDDGDSQSTDED